jgi:8-oxo-dGTP pyrophosphatase MutT (NUDIX family)
MQNSAFLMKEAKRFRVKVGVYLFLIQNNQVLILRRKNTGISDGTYVVPMGCLEEGETVTEAMIREAYEEANVILKPENIQVCHVIHRLHHMPDGYSFTQVDLFFKAEMYDGVIRNMEPHKCDELRFCSIDDLPKNIEPS